MKKIILLLFLILPASCFFQNSATFAQQVTSALIDPESEPAKVTELIFSVDPKNNKINEVFLKEPDMEAQLYLLKGECYRCEFYEGTIAGNFRLNKSRIRPGKKATLTIFTMDNLIPGKTFNPGQFPEGSRFDLGRTRTTVISNQKGSFIVRTN